MRRGLLAIILISSVFIISGCQSDSVGVDMQKVSSVPDIVSHEDSCVESTIANDITSFANESEMAILTDTLQNDVNALSSLNIDKISFKYLSYYDGAHYESIDAECINDWITCIQNMKFTNPTDRVMLGGAAANRVEFYDDEELVFELSYYYFEDEARGPYEYWFYNNNIVKYNIVNLDEVNRELISLETKMGYIRQ